MFSQFFEKKHLRVAGTAKNLSNTGLTEKNNTPKSSLKNLTKLSCQSSQKKSTSPFNTRSKSPISRTYQKNLTSTPKHIGTCPSTEKPFGK